MIEAESAAIGHEPQRVLAIAEMIPAQVLHPASASRCRHRLDVANAHVQLRDYGKAVATLMDLRATAPEWLAQQRYARDVVDAMIRKRRTLTEDMRLLADAVRLPM